MDNHFQFEAAAPEKLGIPPEAVLGFLDFIEARKICLHSFMILRHDKVAAEAYCPPFTPDRLHRMYSCTKTFVSLAIGFLIDEGKLSLSDRAASFFPEYLPQNPHPFITGMTIRDLLLMATAHNGTTYTPKDANWVKTFFTKMPSHAGGTLFNYDTSGTVVLTAIVEKISGLNMVAYLRPKLFDPLGCSQNIWCVERPEGGAWGGSGLLCTTRDLARMALFLLHKGNWQGKQLLSAAYIQDACSPLIDNRTVEGNVEGQFGYGYQIWSLRNKGFAAWGMGSQLAICFPEKDTILVTTADTQSMRNGSDLIMDAFWEKVYPFINDGCTTESAASLRLKERLSSLAFPRVEGKIHSNREQNIGEKKYTLTENPMGIKDMRFSFHGEEGRMAYTNATGRHEIVFGLGKYLGGAFPETHYSGKRIGVGRGSGYEYTASAAWFSDTSLVIYLYIIDDYLGTLKIDVSFKDEGINLRMQKAAEWFLDEYTGFASGA